MSCNVLSVTDDEFSKFKKFIELKIGMKFPETKRTLLESRLAMHIKKRGFDSFNEYFLHLSDEKNHEEFNFFVDKVTTHTTYFFRESEQFDYLIKEGVNLLKDKFHSPQLIKILSLGSSTGEEMYTLALVFNELKREGRINDFEIHGADVSKKVLLQAKSGIFDLKHLDLLDEKYKKYFQIKGGDIYAKAEIKNHLRFFLLNGAKVNQKFPTDYHIVFCRNTLIYFNKVMQQNFIDNIYNTLLSGGLMFLGHSESLTGIEHSFKRIKSSTFIKGDLL